MGAIVGMYLLTLVLRKRETPNFVLFVHGVFVVTALILLITYAREAPGFLETIVIFILAAIGGLVMLVRDLSHKPFPRWLAVAHGLIAIIGFVFLLMNAFGTN